MKKTLFSALAAFALITSIFYLASCGTEDLCAAVDCGPHGKCNATTGTCDCDAGYKKDTNGRCDLLIDPCTAVDCGANATCDKGICSCTAGYEKNSTGKCTITWADKFEGSYSCKDVCKDSKGVTNTFVYETTAKKTTVLNKIEILNFAGFNLTSGAMTVNAANTMSIDFTDATGRIFKGTADFVKAADTTKKDEIKMVYTITYSDKTVDSCIITYTRK
jgi:hypothetical protein